MSRRTVFAGLDCHKDSVQVRVLDAAGDVPENRRWMSCPRNCR
jgi:hypothetical protein